MARVERVDYADPTLLRPHNFASSVRVETKHMHIAESIFIFCAPSNQYQLVELRDVGDDTKHIFC